MLLCKKIKITISRRDAEALEFMQNKCRALYNWWIMKLRDGERWDLGSAKKSLQESKAYDPELCLVYGKLLAEVYFRLDKSMQAFFRRVKAGETKAGFPRVKPRHQFFTLCYPAMYLDVEQGNTIILPTGGRGKHNKRYPNIVAHLTEEPPKDFREVAVTRDACGHYYCSFVYEQAEQDRQPDGIVAFDLGIKTLATGYTTTGRFYHIGGFKGYRWYNKQLDKLRAKRSRCKKGSRRYRYLSGVYKRVSERKRRKQRDCLHKASHLIADRLAESAVVIGDLSQRQMVRKKKQEEVETPQERKKRHIRNRSVYNDWGLYSFVQMLEYKCLLSGKALYIISERDTSKLCHVCHHKKDMPLWMRTYRCGNCGLVMDRDENSAKNISQRFLARLGPHT
jgi:putative transposase